MFLLAADAVECLVQFGALILFLIFTFGGYIAQQLAEANKRREAQQRMRVPPDATTNTASQEIDEFLRQASRQTEAPQANAPAATAASSPRQAAANAVDPYADRSVRTPDPPPTLPAVTTHVSTAALARQASALGEDVALADERMEEHLHERFDHGIGSLGDSSDAVHEDPNKGKLPKEAVTTGEIVDVFRDPSRVREAIVLNEILTRPKWR
jgi:hypothetical protein